jgi:putative thiazole-containing bacteriocin maturation protein
LNQLTSEKSGIFHILGEEDLQQLPLAQCRVQIVDPLSEEPAKLLPSIVCNGLTHHMARKEAGLTGIETYVSRLGDQLVKTLPPPQTGKLGMEEFRELVSFGAGETVAEAVCRGLHTCLNEELNKRLFDKNIVITPMEVGAVEDEHCHYYLQVLTNMYGAPIIGLGEEVSGFPVAWVSTRGRWYGSAGLTTTLALQKALENALLSENDSLTRTSLEESMVLLKDKLAQHLVIEASEDGELSHLLHSSIQVLKRNRKQILFFEVVMDSILKKDLLSVYGVFLREEESL